MKIGIFGGSFDPVHNDHVEICKKFHNELALDKVIVLPAGQSPFKKGHGATAVERKKMLELAFDNCPFVEVSDFELLQEGKSYTYLTVEHFKAIYPNAQLFLLIGLDSLATFLTWKNPDRILANCSLAVISREGYDFEEEERKFKSATGKALFKLFHDGKASSTYVREQLKLKIYSTDYLPERVCDFLKDHGIYVGDGLYESVCKRLSSKRLFHTAGVAATAIGYAKKLGENVDNARIAALLHDIAKYERAENYPDLALPEKIPENVVHQYLSAHIAECELGIKDEDVLNAIRYHTTGRPEMSKLEKIVFVADLLEPSREYDEVDELRQIVGEDFERGFRRCVLRLLKYLERAGVEIFDLTLKTNEYYNK